MSRPLVRSSCGLRKCLGSLSADGWVCALTLLVVWPEGSQHWTLQAVGWGQVLMPKCWSPGWLMPMNTPQYLYHQCSCPHSEPQPPSASLGGPPRPSGRSGPGSYEVTAFSLGPSVHETLCVSSKRGVSLSPSPVEFLQSSPTGLQSWMLWGLLLPMPDPQAGEPDVGSELSLLWENFCDIIILQFVGHPPGWYGIWLYCECAPPTISLWFLLYVFGCRISFLIGSSLFYWWLFSN